MSRGRSRRSECGTRRQRSADVADAVGLDAPVCGDGEDAVAIGHQRERNIDRLVCADGVERDIQCRSAPARARDPRDPGRIRPALRRSDELRRSAPDSRSRSRARPATASWVAAIPTAPDPPLIRSVSPAASFVTSSASSAVALARTGWRLPGNSAPRAWRRHRMPERVTAEAYPPEILNARTSSPTAPPPLRDLGVLADRRETPAISKPGRTGRGWGGTTRDVREHLVVGRVHTSRTNVDGHFPGTGSVDRLGHLRENFGAADFSGNPARCVCGHDPLHHELPGDVRARP